MSFRENPWNLGLGLAIGSLLGSIGGIFVSKKLFFKENQAEIDRIRAFYDAQLKQNLPKKVDFNGSNDIKNVVNLDEKLPNKGIPAEALEADGTPKNIKKYHPKKEEMPLKKYDKYYKTEAVSGNFDGGREEIKIDPYPVPITQSDFRNDHNFKKVSLIYYAKDSVFATFDDTETEYTEDYFGLHNIDNFGALGNWTIYLRDKLTNTDFEIAYDGESDWDTVLMESGGDHDD